MNFPAANTFPFRPSPSWFNAQVGERRLPAAKTVGLLLDRHAGIGPAKNCVTLFAGQALPRDILTPIVAALGPFPSAHLQHDAWTTKAVTDFLWKDGVPALSVIWLGEPDLTEHESAPGAPPALAAIKSSDENLAAVLSALDMPGSARPRRVQASARRRLTFLSFPITDSRRSSARSIYEKS